MDYMKLVADLCQIIDRQNEITKAMVVQLYHEAHRPPV